jgi:hypothetical protein
VNFGLGIVDGYRSDNAGLFKGELMIAAEIDVRGHPDLLQENGEERSRHYRRRCHRSSR